MDTYSGKWLTSLDERLRSRARDVVGALTSSMRHPDRVAELGRKAEAQSPDAVWDGSSLGNGHPGVALMHLYAARAGVTADGLEASLEFLRAAVDDTAAHPLPAPGLYGGTSGLALAMADVRADEPRLAASLDRLHRRLAEQVLGSLPPRRYGEVADHHYDVMTGVSGTLGYLCSIAEPSRQVTEAVAASVDYLVWLTGGHQTPPRLAIMPSRLPPYPGYLDDYPYGYVNFGMSHGVPGIVAALAAAWAAGLRTDRVREALGRAVGRLLAAAQDDGHGPLWPTGVPLDASGREQPRPADHDRLAWCYGTAGCAGALLSAAEALDDDGWRGRAVAAFEAVLRRRPSREDVDVATLCHGYAGLVGICAEFAATGRSPAAAAALPAMVGELLDYADPDRPLLFPDRGDAGELIDDPALLNGAAGVALTLLAVTADRRPAWYRALFLR